MSVSKSKHASDRDPNKQEHNIHYRTYYRNEYNRDNNKRTKIYKSNTRHERDQQRYNITPRQGNSEDAINLNKQTTIIKIMNLKKLEIH